MMVAYQNDIVSALDRAGFPLGVRAFVFGSSVRSDTFHDIDLGIVGAGNAPEALAAAREEMYDSPIPYKVDVVDFDHVDPDFASYVFSHEPILWIR